MVDTSWMAGRQAVGTCTVLISSPLSSGLVPIKSKERHSVERVRAECFKVKRGYILVYWLYAMVVILQSVVEEHQSCLVHHST
jgi:hypothetical protein